MESNPRIGIFVIRFPVVSETFVVNKVRGLLEDGFDVQLFVQTHSEDWPFFAKLGHSEWEQRLHMASPVRPIWRVITQGPISVISTAIVQPRAFARFVQHCWEWRKHNPRGFLRALFTRMNFVGQSMEVLHIVFDMQALAYVDLKYYLGCKLLLSSHAPFHRSSTSKQYPQALEVLYREADGYYFVSQSLLNEALAQGFDAAKPHRVITPAIDPSFFQPTEYPKTSKAEFRVLSVGRLSAQKGYETNLAVIAQAKAAGLPIRYIIVGEGKEREHLQREVLRLRLTDVVEFRGALPHAEVVHEMKGADILLHLARYEGLSSVILEAQAMQLPVICSQVDGLSEAVQDGITGFLIAAGDVESAAQKIILLAQDADLRRRMGQAGRGFVMQHFTLDAQRRAFTDLYLQLVESST